MEPNKNNDSQSVILAKAPTATPTPTATAKLELTGQQTGVLVSTLEPSTQLVQKATLHTHTGMCPCEDGMRALALQRGVNRPDEPSLSRVSQAGQFSIQSVDTDVAGAPPAYAKMPGFMGL